jgi:hypothetical protein
MTLATLPRRPRSAQRRSSSSNERVEILDVMRTLSHLLRVKWRRGGDCIVSPMVSRTSAAAPSSLGK